VVGTAFLDASLVSGNNPNTTISIVGDDPSRRGGASFRKISTTLFQTARVPIVAGRDLNAGDSETGERVALINETFARRFFGESDPIGAKLDRRFGIGGPQDSTIVGVVKDIRMVSSRSSIPSTVFLPALQSVPGTVTFMVRTSGDPRTSVPAIRETLRQIDANLPMFDIKTQQQQVDEGFSTERLFAYSAAFLGAVALFLVSIGLFGLMSFTVDRRTNEIGIRMALGAQRSHVVRLVMLQTLALVLAGILIGLGACRALNNMLARLPLFEVTPTDAVAGAFTIAIMLFVTILAAYLPARRAMRIDPTVALRCD
jgi:predicted permease